MDASYTRQGVADRGAGNSIYLGATGWTCDGQASALRLPRPSNGAILVDQ